MTSDAIDLAPKDLAILTHILQQYLPQYEVRAFGSRVHHTAKKFSDLDLVIMSDQPLALSLLGDLADAFSNSELPIKVDVLDWARLNDDFREVILKKYVVLTL